MKINNYKKDPQGIGRIKIIDDLITVMESKYCYLDKDSNEVNWIEKYNGLTRIEEENVKRFPVWMDGNSDRLFVVLLHNFHPFCRQVPNSNGTVLSYRCQKGFPKSNIYSNNIGCSRGVTAMIGRRQIVERCRRAVLYRNI